MQGEREIQGVAGWLMVCVLFFFAVAIVGMVVKSIQMEWAPGIIGGIFVLALNLFCFAGLTVINPNQAKVTTLQRIAQTAGILVGESADHSQGHFLAGTQL